MSVLQINLWRCDRCPRREAVIVDTDPYSDPVVTPPEGWAVDEGDLCPECKDQDVSE